MNSYIKIPQTTTGGETMRRVIDGDGKIKVWAKANAAITLGYVYKMGFDETGKEAVALSGTAAFQCQMGIAEKALATGAYGWFIVGGPCTQVFASAITSSAIGYALKIHNGAVTATGAAWSGATPEYAVCKAILASATSASIIMVDHIITATT
jgi:hypothetical protein